jgi:4-amino-4-deoxy-L-arabinose transferase-like glycosyltransferase
MTPLTRGLLLVAAASLFIGLSGAPLFDLDEGAFTAATLEMFARDDFLMTYLMGEPRTDKPILIYWLQAASVALFGWQEWALRLPSALAALAWMAMAYAFARRLYDENTAVAAAVLTATTLGVALVSHAATADALLNAALAGALFAQYFALREENRRFALMAWALMGLGFLTKGPVALILPLGTAFLYCASRREWAQFFRYGLDWRGIGLFVVIALPWYAAVTATHGTVFIEGFFLKHNVARYAGAMEGHGGGPLYYLPVLLILALPFTGLIFGLMRDLRGLWRDDFGCYAAILFLWVLALFSFSATKLPHYLLYGCSLLWIVLARRLVMQPVSRGLWLAPLLLAGFWLFFPDIVSSQMARLQPRYQVQLSDLYDIFDHTYRAVWLAVLGLALFGLAWRAQHLALLGIAVLLLGALTTHGVAHVGQLLQGSVREAGRIAATLDAPLVMQGLDMPSFSVYAGRVVHKRDPVAGDVVVTRSDWLAQMPAHEVLYRNKGIVLVRVRP